MAGDALASQRVDGGDSRRIRHLTRTIRGLTPNGFKSAHDVELSVIAALDPETGELWVGQPDADGNPIMGLSAEQAAGDQRRGL